MNWEKWVNPISRAFEALLCAIDAHEVNKAKSREKQVEDALRRLRKKDEELRSKGKK